MLLYTDWILSMGSVEIRYETHSFVFNWIYDRSVAVYLNTNCYYIFNYIFYITYVIHFYTNYFQKIWQTIVDSLYYTDISIKMKNFSMKKHMIVKYIWTQKKIKLRGLQIRCTSKARLVCLFFSLCLSYSCVNVVCGKWMYVFMYFQRNQRLIWKLMQGFNCFVVSYCM